MPVQMPHRVLVIRVGRMGDLVMITPALRLLLDGLPGAEIHLLTTAEGRRVLAGFDPRVTQFHVFRRKFPDSWFGRGRLEAELRAHDYARAYVFETHPRYASLARRIAPEVHALGVPTGIRHYSARCLEVVERTLARPLPRGWLHLPVTEAGRSAASTYLAEHGLGANDWLVGMHLTFSESSRGWFAGRRGRNHREWTLEQGAGLAKLLHEHGRSRGIAIRPVLDVLPHERGMLAPFDKWVGDAVTVLSGPPQFDRYKALLERCRLFVTPNSGPMHVAAAVGTPVVALFSRWSPLDCGPFVPPGRAAVLRAEEGPHPERGLASITAAAVFAGCRRFLP